MPRPTAFVAIRLSIELEVDDIRLVLKLPAEGMPEGRRIASDDVYEIWRGVDAAVGRTRNVSR